MPEKVTSLNGVIVTLEYYSYRMRSYYNPLCKNGEKLFSDDKVGLHPALLSMIIYLREKKRMSRSLKAATTCYV